MNFNELIQNEYFLAITFILAIAGFLELIFKPIRKIVLFYKSLKTKRLLIDRLHSLANERIDRHKNNSKYIPDTFTECSSLKDQARYFINPFFYFEKIILDYLNYDFSIVAPEVQSILNSKSLQKHRKKVLRYLNVFYKLPTWAKKNKITKYAQYLEKHLYLPYQSLQQEKHFQATNKINAIFNDSKSLISRCMLIKADAGQGKTNFLCDLISTHIFPHKNPCLFIDGVDIRKSEEILDLIYDSIQDLVKKDDVLPLLNQLGKQKPFIIIIDSINETSFPIEMLRTIKNLLIILERYPNIKLIFSCRTKYFECHYTDLKSTHLMKNSSILIQDIAPKMSKIARKYLFDAYKTHFNFKCAMRTSIFDEITKDFLLLRIFSESYKNENIGLVDNIYTGELYKKFYDSNIFPISTHRNIINEICRYMIKNKIYSKVNIDSFAKQPNIILQDLTNYADNNLVIRRDIEQKKTDTISWESLSFTVDDIRDYLLSAYLINEYLNGDSELLSNFLSNEINEDSPLHEGMTKHLFFVSKASKNVSIINLLSSQPWWNNSVIKHALSTRDILLNSDDIKIIHKEMQYNDRYFKKVIDSLIFRIDTQQFPFFNVGVLNNFLINIDEDFIDKKFLPLFRVWPDSVRRHSSSSWFPINDFCDFFTQMVNDTPGKPNNFCEFHNLLVFLFPVNYRYNLYEKTKEIYINFAKHHPFIAKQQLINAIKGKSRSIRNESIKVFIVLLNTEVFSSLVDDLQLLEDKLIEIFPDPAKLRSDHSKMATEIIAYLENQKHKSEKLKPYYETQIKVKKEQEANWLKIIGEIDGNESDL
jgi:hypothetical protein